MVQRETVRFVFWPRVLNDVILGNIRTLGKTKLTNLLRDHTLSVLLYLFFRLSLEQSYSKMKQAGRASNNCAIVSRSGYI